MTTEQLWRQLHERLRGFIRRRVATEHDADDVLQEVFLRIHRNLGRLEDETSLLAWVHRIASNAVADHHRARGRSRDALETLRRQPAEVHEDAPSGRSPGQDLVCCLEPFLEALPPDAAEALSLTDLGGLTQTEAARRLGLTASGMKSRVQRGRRRIRDLLEQCCRIEVDRRGNVVDYDRRDRDCC